MKKLFVCALAASMFTACSQDETISQQSPMQISFDGAFVENATRAAIDPSITTDNITNFDVWGFMESTTGDVFTQEKVTKNGSDWTYADIQYWVPEKDFYFAAVAPSDQEEANIKVNTTSAGLKGLGVIDFTNVDAGNIDLLYSAVGPLNGSTMIEESKKVEFTFHHMLSKVKFTFTNGFANENTNIIISNIQMTAPKHATIDVSKDLWWEGHKWSTVDGSVILKFGNMDPNNEKLIVTEDGTKMLANGESVESANECLTIPAVNTQEYIVTFYVEVRYGDVIAFPAQLKTATIKGVALERAKAYNFVTTLNASNFSDDVEENPLKPIEFNVIKVDEWINVDNKALVTTLPGTITGNLTLVANAQPSETVKMSEGAILDGAGHTLDMYGINLDNYLTESTLRLISTSKDATIKNLTIDGHNIIHDTDNNAETTANNYGIRGIYMTGEGTVTIDNVTIKNVTYTLNDDAAAKTLKVINSSFEGWTSYNATATFEKVAFSKGAYGRLRPYSNTTLTDCTFTAEYILDLTKLSDGEKVTLKNCKVGGTVISAENYSTLFTIEGYDANKIEFVTE